MHREVGNLSNSEASQCIDGSVALEDGGPESKNTESVVENKASICQFVVHTCYEIVDEISKGEEEDILLELRVRFTENNHLFT